MKYLVFLCLAFVVLECASAQALWKDTAYGMSLDEVRQRMPDAISPPESSALHSGAKCLLELEHVLVLGDAFSACFYFIDNRLQQVTLTHSNPDNFGVAALDFEKLLTALRAKYGKEVKSKKSNATTYDIRGATWTSGKTDISLNLIAVTGSDAILNIVYQTQVANNMDNL